MAQNNVVLPIPNKGALTMQELTEAMPKQVRSKIQPGMLAGINAIMAGDKHIQQQFKENLLGYSNVLTKGKHKISSYINATRYVSYKLMGDTNVAAYCKTFPAKTNQLRAEGADDKVISSYVAGYNKSKLVNLIWEQTLIPTYVLNADVFQEAINIQAELMRDARSEKVRSDAANSLLNHLKQPETAKIELDVNIKSDSIIDDLRATTLKLAATQKQMLEDKTTSTDAVANSKLIIDGVHT